MSWNELSLKDKADYIKESVNNGIYNLSDIRNRYNMYANGGYKPSESIKKRITNWEGSSMRTNRSFQAEANDFNRVIPSSIRSKLSQQQLDALYSYGYNVGMGNLKKRVLPTLTNYVQGKASNEDVQKSMWASKDNELRGLTTRRNIERSLFGGKYQTVFTGTGGTPHNYGYTATTNTNRSSSNPYQIQNEEWQGKNYLDAYKGLQLSMNNIMGKTKETDIDDLFSTGIGPIISMENLMSIGNNNVAPVQPDYSYAKSLLSDFDSDLNNNMFDEGGNLNFIDADNRRSNILLHTEDGNLYDSAGNNYTQSYLDEENVPIIKGTMPRNTRQYYDPNTTIDFINAATLGLLNRGSISQDVRLMKDAYNTISGNMSYNDLINSATLGNKGIFNNPAYNTLLDFAVPITGYGLSKGLNSNYIRSRIASPFVKSALSPNNFNKSLASSNYILDNLSKMYPNLSETELSAIYRNAFNKKDYLTGQLIRDLHYLNTAGNNAILDGANPRVTYHGTNYGNFSVFDSSQSNATIGGSAATGEKGNFTTDDLKAALNYGEVNPEYLYYGDNKPITDSPFDKYIDVKNLRDWRNTDFLSHVGNDAQRVVYPLYTTSNNPSKIWDFKGNSWSKYPNPNELGRRWELEVVHDFPMEESGKKNQGFTETFLNRKSLYDRIQQLKKEGYTIGEKEYDYDYTNHKKIATGWRRYRTGYWDNVTNKRIHYPEIKAIDKVSSARYKPTTNGVVQQSFEKGNDAVFINNVEDANAKDNWAINEIIFRNANQAKLANPFTVDDNNNLISILKRDNFLNPDIRYKNGGFLNNYLSLC
nr:MAG: ADP-ribosyltransferase [Bacteriophage sp.]